MYLSFLKFVEINSRKKKSGKHKPVDITGKDFIYIYQTIFLLNIYFNFHSYLPLLLFYSSFFFAFLACQKECLTSHQNFRSHRKTLHEKFPNTFSGPYLPVFGPEETSYLDTFHPVKIEPNTVTH